MQELIKGAGTTSQKENARKSKNMFSSGLAVSIKRSAQWMDLLRKARKWTLLRNFCSALDWLRLSSRIFAWKQAEKAEKAEKVSFRINSAMDGCVYWENTENWGKSQFFVPKISRFIVSKISFEKQSRDCLMWLISRCCSFVKVGRSCKIFLGFQLFSL